MSAAGQQETNGAPFPTVRTWGYSRRNLRETGSGAQMSVVGGTAAVDSAAFGRRLLAKGLSISEGCRLMHLARSTYYDPPTGQPIVEARLAARITEICAEWPRYGSLAVNRTSCWRCS